MKIEITIFQADSNKPKLDLAFKSGQTIKINIGGNDGEEPKKTARPRAPKAAASAG